jgi:hypothetical protein
MKSALSPVDLGDEILAVGDAYRASSNAVRNAIDTYETRGLNLEGAVAGQLAAFYDPKRNRALEIQEAARTLSERIREFEPILDKLREQAGFVGATLSGALMLNALEMAALPPVGQPGSNTQVENLASIHSFLEGLDNAQLRLTYLAARGIKAGLEVERAFRVAGELIEIREAKLAEYLGEAPPIDVRSKLVAIRSTMTTAGGIELFGELAKEAALALGASVPVVGMAVAAVRLTLDVREKLNELDVGYERGEVDAMLDFRRQVAGEDNAMEGLLSLFEQTEENLSKDP